MDIVAEKPANSSTYRITSSLNESLLLMEDICARLLESRFSTKNDTERMYWQQRFKNIVTRISLALAEVRGPRKFHQHYKHDDSDSVLLPVLENPLDMLAHACEQGLKEINKKLVGVHDNDLLRHKSQLEKCLNSFLIRYNEQKHSEA
ncbi:MAG: hypothetical protein R3D71_05420 [Rickettsiales bacterium]